MPASRSAMRRPSSTNASSRRCLHVSCMLLRRRHGRDAPVYAAARQTCQTIGHRRVGGGYANVCTRGSVLNPVGDDVRHGACEALAIAETRRRCRIRRARSLRSRAVADPRRLRAPRRRASPPRRARRRGYVEARERQHAFDDGHHAPGGSLADLERARSSEPCSRSNAAIPVPNGRSGGAWRGSTSAECSTASRAGTIRVDQELSSSFAGIAL